MITQDLKIPPAELVDTEKLRVDGYNPNKLSVRRFEALKKSIQRWGFVVPIITNRDYLVADGEHRLKAAKELGMKQVSVVRLLVDDVDRRLLRQVMNKIRGEHDLFLDAEEYYRIVSEDSRDLIKKLLNESDLRIYTTQLRKKKLHRSEKENRTKTQESKAHANSFPHFQTLESNNGIPQNKRHSACQATSRP